jgi:hypothetical protein
MITKPRGRPKIPHSVTPIALQNNLKKLLTPRDAQKGFELPQLSKAPRRLHADRRDCILRKSSARVNDTHTMLAELFGQKKAEPEWINQVFVEHQSLKLSDMMRATHNQLLTYCRVASALI